MYQEQKLSDDIEQFLHNFENADEEQPGQQETIHVYFVREEAEPQDDVIETTLAPSQNTKNTPSLFTIATIIFCLCLPLSSILFQLYLAFNPPIVTVTIIPIVQTVKLTATVRLGRMTHPITLSQSQTTPTTGKGHQDATTATGELTLYNGQSTEQTIPAGTIFIGADGIQVSTDETVTIPAGNPPTYGLATVTAHAASPGERGNIAPGDINTTVTIAVIAKNITSFTGGQDARTLQVVAKRDIETTATQLKTTLLSAMTGALQGELKPGEVLLTLPCMPTVKSDHQPGDEAARVTITVSQTCDGIAYSGQELQTKATELLTHLAMTKLGAGYTLVGNVQIIVHRAIIIGMTPNLMFSSQGTWIYGLSGIAQEHLKRLIAGKTAQEAEHILSALPGIKNVAMQWDETTKLPKDPQHIKFLVLVEM